MGLVLKAKIVELVYPGDLLPLGILPADLLFLPAINH
jgi:hypothetical protein